MIIKIHQKIVEEQRLEEKVEKEEKIEIANFKMKKSHLEMIIQIMGLQNKRKKKNI